MIYFISSSTKWPADKDKSVFFRYNYRVLSRFGIFYLIPDSRIILSFENDLKATFFNKDLSNGSFIEEDGRIIKNDNINFGNYIGYRINDIIFSFLILSDDNIIKYDNYELYADRAFNIFEYLDKNDDDFWSSFEALLKLSFREMKNTRKTVDTFFMYMSFFPARVTADLKSFYAKLFSILNKYPKETFVIIVDQKTIKTLSFFKGLIEKHREDFDSEIIVRINPKITIAKKMMKSSDNKSKEMFCYLSDEQNYEWTIPYYGKIKNDFLTFTARFRDADISSILINHFDNVTKIAIRKKGNYFATDRKRLLDSSTRKTFDLKFSSYKSVKAFFDKYLRDNASSTMTHEEYLRYQKRYFKCFQRFPFDDNKTDGKIIFNPEDIEEHLTWSKLSTKISEYRLDQNLITDEEADEKVNNQKDLSRKTDDYNQVKYLCGKVYTTSDYMIPENNDIMKELIFKAGICAELSFDTILDILKQYGFSFVRFSLKDLMYEFIIRKSQCTQPIDKGVLYGKLVLLIKDKKNPVKIGY